MKSNNQNYFWIDNILLLQMKSKETIQISAIASFEK